MAGHDEELPEAVRRRAHELSESDEAGTDEDNRLRAERDLTGGDGFESVDDGDDAEPWAKTSSGDTGEP